MSVRGKVTFEVSDAFMPANAGRWTLSVPGDRGAAVVERAASGVAPDLVLDTADLATVYLGAFTFADLARAGRVRECRMGRSRMRTLCSRRAGRRHRPRCSDGV